MKRVDDRRVLNGIFFLRTGIPWRNLPQQYGPYTTAYNRFNRWSKAGIWNRIMGAVVDAHNGDVVMIDGTSLRVHHAAATLKKRPAAMHGALPGGIHALTNENGLPLRYLLAPGQAHDAPPAKILLNSL